MLRLFHESFSTFSYETFDIVSLLTHATVNCRTPRGLARKQCVSSVASEELMLYKASHSVHALSQLQTRPRHACPCTKARGQYGERKGNVVSAAQILLACM